VVTTLTDAAVYPAKELGSLFRQRWHAEISHPDYPSSCSLYHGSWAA
jgi:hypothetical protein